MEVAFAGSERTEGLHCPKAVASSCEFDPARRHSRIGSRARDPTTTAFGRSRRTLSPSTNAGHSRTPCPAVSACESLPLSRADGSSGVSALSGAES
jgi:hypothetical protein